MRKKLLSLALALVMCLGLTVPVFAAKIDVTYSVDPIGVATIQGAANTFETVYVFDQDVLVTPKDGRSFTHFYSYDVNFYGSFEDYDGLGDVSGELQLWGTGIAQVHKELWAVMEFEVLDTANGVLDSSPFMTTKAYIDELIAEGVPVDFKPYTSAPTTVGNFTDVKTSDYFAESVQWAVEKKITTGTSAATFSPHDTCTQGQILTFLWRAKGEPKPAGAVSGTQYYAAAAQWAKEQGLTDNFSAGADCTRAMVVTYLWKLAGSPKTGSSDFSDVPAGADYAQAVAWAVERGITTGTSDTTFSPDSVCTRGQIVTFLCRALAK